MKLKTKRLILRDLEKVDENDLVKAVNNLNVTRYFLVVPYPYSRKDGEWFVNHCKEKAKEKPRENYEWGLNLRRRLWE
jgi:hypothetical protein